MEPRARAGRHKSGLNFGTELSALLYAYGAPTHPDIAQPIGPSSAQYLSTLPTPNTHSPPTPFNQPFPETVRVLDEILTDFIIETCHNAVGVATYSGRTKLKLSDFEMVLRRDSVKLGRVQEMFKKRKEIEKQRKLFQADEGREKMAVDDLMNLGEVAGEEGTGKGKGRGRGRRKKRERTEGDSGAANEGKENGADEDADERGSKRAKSEAE